jgi:hypothetical protein
MTNLKQKDGDIALESFNGYQMRNSGAATSYYKRRIMVHFSFMYAGFCNNIVTATTFLVFYRFKAMNKEEKQKAESEWHQIKNSLLKTENSQPK